MKKHVLMAAVLASVCLAAGCSSTPKETEKATEAKVQTEAATESAEESVAESAEGISEAVEEESETEKSAASDIVELGARPEYKALDYVTVGEYKGLAVEVDPIVVTQEEIDSAVSSAISTAGKNETLTEGTVEEGDVANIDYVGKKDDVAFDGGTAEGYDLTIGSGTFIDGFEAGLVGVAVGDTVDLNLTFPENYGSSELAGQDVVFTVNVNSVQRTPELTDALASELSDGAYTTVDAYRAYQEQQLYTSKETSQKSLINNELMTQLYNTCTVNETPDELVQYSLTEMNNYYASYAEAYGMSLDDFITTYFGMDRESYETQAIDTIKVSIQQELILVAIAENEGMEIDDEAFNAGASEYAQQLGYENVEDFINSYDKEKIRVSLMMDKAMDFVRENAVITEKEEETEAVTEAVTEAAEAAEETEAVTESANEDTAEEVTEGVTE